MKTKVLENLVEAVTIVIIFLVSVFVMEKMENLYYALAIFVGLSGIFVLQGLKKIPEDPPHKGILTILGRRQYRIKNGVKTAIYLDEGWKFFPLYPIVFGYVSVNVERKPFDITVVTRTPDRAEVEVTISVTLRPVAEYLIQYEDSGGFKGIKQHLGGEIEERVREWAEGLQEGPMDWREIYQAKLEAASILIKRIAGNGLVGIPKEAQEIPTYILLKYVSVPKIEGNEEDEKKVAKNEWPWIKNNWERVENILNNLPPEVTKDNVIEQAKKRKEQVQKIRSGEGKTDIIDLGMRLERLNISNVKVIGEAGKTADQEAKEQEELQAEALEIGHILTQLERLRDEGKYTPEQALEILQTERGKVTKAVDEKKLNISSETRELIKLIGKDTLDAIFSKKGGK